MVTARRACRTIEGLFESLLALSYVEGLSEGFSPHPSSPEYDDKILYADSNYISSNSGEVDVK